MLKSATSSTDFVSLFSFTHVHPRTQQIHKKTWFMAEIVGYTEEADGGGTSTDSSGNEVRFLDIKCTDTSPFSRDANGKVYKGVHPDLLSYFELEACENRETKLKWATQATDDAAAGGSAASGRADAVDDGGDDAIEEDDEDEEMAEAGAGAGAGGSMSEQETDGEAQIEGQLPVLVDGTKAALDLSGSGPPVQVLCRLRNWISLSKLRWQWGTLVGWVVSG
jgi:hypothetical protein